MRKLLLLIFALCSAGFAQTAVEIRPQLNGIYDPCQSPFVVKSSAVINITTATTTNLVAAVTGQAIYVCGFTVTTGATVAPNTIQFEYGTGATCGTGTVLLTGTLNAAGVLTGTVQAGSAGQMILSKVIASNALCAVSTVGTGPSLQGFVTYAQF